MTKTNKMEDARGRRLFADLNHAFRKDPLIDEYDFLPVPEPQHNASPLLLEEHKLGLELWSVRLLFQYAYKHLMNSRQRSQSATFVDPQELGHLSRAVLLISPDCYTAWNIRKELIENGDISIAEDLKLGQLILTKFPKSGETLIHRRWLFQRLVNQCLSSSRGSSVSSDGQPENDSALLCMDGIDISLTTNASARINDARTEEDSGIETSGRTQAFLMLESSRLLAENLHNELDVCERAADGYASNYYAWTHRAWLVRQCFKSSLQLLLEELTRTKAWSMKHVSDHSGFYYRQFLLTSISQQTARLHRLYAKTVSSLIDGEHDFICDLIQTFPNHEAMWCHRKFVFHMMMTTVRTHNSEPSPASVVINGESYAMHGAISKHDGQKRSRLESHSPYVLIQRERDAVQKIILQTKEAYQETLGKRYMEWLDKSFPSQKET